MDFLCYEERWAIYEWYSVFCHQPYCRFFQLLLAEFNSSDVIRGLFWWRWLWRAVFKSSRQCHEKAEKLKGWNRLEERDEQNFAGFSPLLVDCVRLIFKLRGVQRISSFFSWEVCMLFATDVPLHRFHGIRFKVKRRLVVGRQSIFILYLPHLMQFLPYE